MPDHTPSGTKGSMYKELMKIKQTGEDVIFYAKYNNNLIEELLLIAGGNTAPASPGEPGQVLLCTLTI